VTLTRRATVAALPLIALTGCRWGPEEDAAPAVEQAKDADSELVKTAADAITRMSRSLTVVAEDHIGLAAALAPLTAMHDAHLRLLSSSPTSPGRTPIGQESSRAALARIRRDEARLQTVLAALAVAATSGPLARALASMSASIAQHLAVLPQIAAQGPA
jgi:signal transduction histidine kinase